MAETHWAINLILVWLPFVIFIAAVMWHARQMRKCLTSSDGRSMADAFGDLARELKRANDLRSPPAT